MRLRRLRIAQVLVKALLCRCCLLVTWFLSLSREGDADVSKYVILSIYGVEVANLGQVTERPSPNLVVYVRVPHIGQYRCVRSWAGGQRRAGPYDTRPIAALPSIARVIC